MSLIYPPNYVDSLWSIDSRFPYVLAVAASVLAGALIGTDSLAGMGAVLAIPIATIILMRPLYGLIIVFFIVNVLFIFDRTQRIGLTLPVTGGTISATDLLYALIMTCVIWRVAILKDTYFPRNKLTVPFTLLLVWSVISLVAGILQGNEVKKSLIEWRPFLYMSIFYFAIFFARDESTFFTLLKGFYWAYIATFMLGFLIFVQGRKAIEYYTMGQIDAGESALPRFTFVSSDLVLTLLYMSMGLIIFLQDSRLKNYLIALSVVLGINLLLIQARTQVLALFVGMIPIIILAPGLKRMKLLAAGLAGVIFLALALFALAQTESGGKKIIDPILERFSGIYKSQTNVDQSLERRRMEADVVWPKIEERPITGYTLGAKWSDDPKWVTVYKHDPTYIHSSWLFFLFKLGLIGTVLMITVMYRASILALSIVRDERNPYFRGIALGILATMPTYVFAGFLQPTLWHFQMAPVIGFEFAAVVIMSQLLKSSDAESQGS
jgi:O-antigen ligase